MNVGVKIQRCNFLPEGEMAIIKDTNTLIHNIVDSELKEKDKEIERLKNAIKELEDFLYEWYKRPIKEQTDYDDQLTIGCIIDKFNELKLGSDSNE